MRVGIGYDSHKFVKRRTLKLGGVEVPHVCGLMGHSDADVVLHAICDAILGALGKGDIGEHFPDTDPAYKDIDSTKLLAQVVEMAKKDGYVTENLDLVVLLQKPKLNEYKKRMAEKIAEVLGVAVGSVNIKAKTDEGMGFVGRAEGAACYATVLLKQKS